MSSIPPSLAVWLLLLLVLQASGKPRISTRIIGGQTALEGKWPWQVSVLRHGKHVCGGSLIAPQWVVSAAHCFCHLQIQGLYQVKLGAFNLRKPSSNEVTSDVKQIIIHPDYKGYGTSDGDIALVELKCPVTFTPNIRPVFLPQSSTWFPLNAECWVTGWGISAMYEEIPSETLQELQVPLIDKDSCSGILRDSLNDDYFHALNQSNVLCAGYKQEGKDACEGDSGGPLVCKDQERWILTGLVSWGPSCLKSKLSDVSIYTAVSPFGDWINKTTNSGLL